MARIGVQIFLSNQLTQLKKPCYEINKRYIFIPHNLTVTPLITRTGQTTFVSWRRNEWNFTITNTNYNVRYHASDRTIIITDTGNLDVSYTHCELKITIECNKNSTDIYLQPDVAYDPDYVSFLTVHVHDKLKPFLSHDLRTAAIPIVNELMSITKQQLQDLLL